MLLPLSPSERQEWLLRYIAGEWIVKGYEQGTLLELDYHEYCGEVQDNTFTITGPWHRHKVPLVIRGILQPAAEAVYLHLTIRPHLRSLLGIAALVFCWLALFVVRVSSGLLVFFGLFVVMGSGLTYVAMVLHTHWQCHLLFARLSTCAREFTKRGTHDQ